MAILQRKKQEQQLNAWDYIIEFASDIAALPVMPEIEGGSTAFITDRNTPRRLLFLTNTGWV